MPCPTCNGLGITPLCGAPFLPGRRAPCPTCNPRSHELPTEGHNTMTFEQMQEIAALVRDALNASPDFTDAEVLTDALEAGQPLPVAFIDNDGNELVVALDVL